MTDSYRARREEFYGRLSRVRARAYDLARSGHCPDLDAIRAALEWEGYGEDMAYRAVREAGQRTVLRRLISRNAGQKRFDA